MGGPDRAGGVLRGALQATHQHARPTRRHGVNAAIRQPTWLTTLWQTIGRATLPVPERKTRPNDDSRFSHTKHALRLLEQLSVCVARNEPVLLVGETGNGKTAVIQHLAAQVGHPLVVSPCFLLLAGPRPRLKRASSQLGRKLVVQNLNQQTDSEDFLGGAQCAHAYVDPCR